MKALLIVFTAACLLLWHTIAAASAACSILNREKVEVGSREGVRGICSNNNLPVTCTIMEGEGLAHCDGPSGGYTGSDIDSLLFSACGCSPEQEREERLKKQLKEAFPDTGGRP